MVLKRKVKDYWYTFGWILLCIGSLIIRRLSVRSFYAFAGLVGRVGYLMLGKHRRVAFDGLRQAFGGTKTHSEISRIAKKCFNHIAKSGGELIFFLGKPRLVRSRMAIVNKEYLDSALAAGRGVIVVTAHYGNFVMILWRLSLEGYKTSVIMRPLKDQRYGGMFEAERARLDIQTIFTIPRKSCVEESIRALRNNRILLVPLDQNFGTGGVFVDFFGRKAATAIGPVVLARRTHAAIVPAFMVRNEDDTHTLFIEPQVQSVRRSTEQETIVDTVQRITGVIEGYIRKYPAEWSWVHRRWKSKPRS